MEWLLIVLINILSNCLIWALVTGTALLLSLTYAIGGNGSLGFHCVGLISAICFASFLYVASKTDK
jgi:hypothetical protein